MNLICFFIQMQWMCMFLPTGWKPNQRFACFYVFHGVNGVGWVGWGGVITFICTSSHIWCNAAVRLFALPHIHDATPLYVVLHFLTYMMLRYCTSSCASSHIWCNAAVSHAWCYATVRRLALPHIHDATLLYVVLHFLTSMMLRYCTSSCTSSHVCYASVRRLALPHIYDATLVYVLGSGDGKTVPTKTSPSSLQKLWRTLSAEKKRVPLRCFTYPVKSTRVLFKEIELWERCKTTVICGMKSMTNTANVESAGSINNPPGCFSAQTRAIHIG